MTTRTRKANAGKYAAQMRMVQRRIGETADEFNAEQEEVMIIRRELIRRAMAHLLMVFLYRLVWAANIFGTAFAILVHARLVAFRLPARHEGVFTAMKRDTKIPRSLCTPEQALRVSWRIIKDWTEAQLAIIDAELASLAEVFLPYAVTNDGVTLYERFEHHGLPMLSQSEKDGE